MSEVGRNEVGARRGTALVPSLLLCAACADAELSLGVVSGTVAEEARVSRGFVEIQARTAGVGLAAAAPISGGAFTLALPSPGTYALAAADAAGAIEVIQDPAGTGALTLELCGELTPAALGHVEHVAQVCDTSRCERAREEADRCDRNTQALCELRQGQLEACQGGSCGPELQQILECQARRPDCSAELTQLDVCTLNACPTEYQDVRDSCAGASCTSLHEAAELICAEVACGGSRLVLSPSFRPTGDFPKLGCFAEVPRAPGT